MQAASLLVLALLPLAAPPAAAKKTVFVITDAEGVAGICRQEQTEPTSPELQKLLTGEVNAAVRGFLSAGADEVIVWDGHDGSRTLSAATLEAPGWSSAASARPCCWSAASSRWRSSDSTPGPTGRRRSWRTATARWGSSGS